MKTLTVKTSKRCQFINITREVASAVASSGVTDGLAVVYCPHTTAGITINENADPAVVKDILMKTGKLVEKDDPGFTHAEGNSDSHVRSSIIGASETIIIEGGKLVLGTWQGIFFAEFDGPRTRSVHVKVVKG